MPIPISVSELTPFIWDRVQKNLAALESHRPLSKDSLRALRQQLRVIHTYNSNAIEGNTLTLKETQLVVEHGITIGGKSLREHLEATNNAQAFDWIWENAKPGLEIDHVLLQRLHEMVTRGIIESAGRYRTQQVWIGGAEHTPPQPARIIRLMDDLFSEIQRIKEPVVRSIHLHHRLAYIHPFLDGNGRVSRLAANLVLMSGGYPPIVLRFTDRRRYYRTLQEADKGKYRPFAGFVLRAVDEALAVFLAAVEPERALVPLRELVGMTPYSHEYLSLRARQGSLEAVKIGDVWHSSKRAIRDYLEARGQGGSSRSESKRSGNRL